jgi:protein TonB
LLFAAVVKLVPEKQEVPPGGAPYVVRIIKVPPPVALPPPGAVPEPQKGRAGVEGLPSTRPPEPRGAGGPPGAEGEIAEVGGELSAAPSNAPEAGLPGDVASLPRGFRPDIFDREAIGEAARGEKRPGGKEGAKGALTFDTREFMYRGYMDRLKAHIEYIWKYPPEAASKGIYGDLRITFVIRKDGKLGSVKLERTSGHKMLDDAAMKALRDAAPFWPLPEEWGQEAFTINGHFIYTLHGAYIR